MTAWPANSPAFWIGLMVLTVVLTSLVRRRVVYGSTREGRPIRGRWVTRRGAVWALALAAAAACTALLPTLLYFGVPRWPPRGVSWADVLWRTGAACLLVLALGMVSWGLSADHARGRRRCPKCWYDMADAATGPCPECGLTAPNEAALGRTRRRPRLAMLAALPLAGAWVMWNMPVAQRVGAWAMAPNWALLAAMPLAPADTRVSLRIVERAGALSQRGGMSFAQSPAWERQLGLWSSRAALKHSRDPSILTVSALALLRSDEADRAFAVACVEEMVKSPDDPIRLAGVYCMGGCPEIASTTMPWLERSLGSTFVPEVQLALQTIWSAVEAGALTGPAPEALLDALLTTDTPSRYMACSAIGCFSSTDASQAVLVARATGDSQPTVRAAALHALARHHGGEAWLRSLVRDALLHGTNEEKDGGAQLAGELGLLDDEALEAFLTLPSIPNRNLYYGTEDAFVTMARSGVPLERKLDILCRAAADPALTNRAIEALAFLEADARPAAGVLRQTLKRYRDPALMPSIDPQGRLANGLEWCLRMIDPPDRGPLPHGADSVP